MAPRARRKWRKKERKNLETPSNNFSFDPLNYEEFIPKVNLNTEEPNPLDYNPVPEDENSLDISLMNEVTTTHEREDNVEIMETLVFDNFLHMVNSMKSFIDEFDLPIEDVLLNYPFELVDDTPPYFYDAVMSDSSEVSDDEMSVDFPPSADSQDDLPIQESIIHGDACPGPIMCPEHHINYTSYYEPGQDFSDSVLVFFDDIISSRSVESTKLIHFASSADHINRMLDLYDELSLNCTDAAEYMNLSGQEDEDLFDSYWILSELIAEELDIPLFDLPDEYNFMFIRKRFGILYDDEPPPPQKNVKP